MNESPPATAWLETAALEKIPIEGALSLGRSEKNSVHLPDISVSRRHALLNCQHDGEYWLVDLGSANGTRLNARRVYQPVKLRDGDRIELSGHAFVFRQIVEQEENEQPTVSAMTVPEFSTEPLWLLLADIEGFTPLSQKLPPDQLAVLIGGWFLACQKIVEKHRGGIYKFLGDGFLASWPDDDASAVRVAEAARDLASTRGNGPPFRCVVHRGMVATGRSPMAGEEGMVGAPINFIFRLEKLAADLQESMLFSAEAHAKLSPHVAAVPRGAHAVKGFEGRFAVFAPEARDAAAP